jgi:hypothetical protein
VISTPAHDVTLMALWSRPRAACRSVGQIVADARTGALPGIEPQPNIVHDNMAFPVDVACSGRTTYDSLCFIAMSRGLHSAGEAARAAGGEEWGRELHSMGQLFLQFATGDIEHMVAEHVGTIIASIKPQDGELVH